MGTGEGSATAAGAGGSPYMQMGPKAISYVRVVDLVHPQYRGRRVAFNGVVGSFVGFVQTAATGVDADGNSVGVDGPQRLWLRDDNGREYYLDFVAEDTVTLVREPR